MYDVTINTAINALKDSSTAVFTNDTLVNILKLTTVNDAKVTFDTVMPDVNGTVTVAAGTEVALVTTSDTQKTTLTVSGDAPVVIFQGKGGIDATINDGTVTVPAHAAGVIDRVVVGSSGNDHIVIADAKNTQITLGSGNSTIVAGHGEDTIVAGLGNSTVSGGTGHAIVELKGNASDYTVTVDNGHAIVSGGSNQTTTDITKIQYVQLDNGKALVFADSTQQAAVTTLYETAFGRTADAGGLQYWFDKAAAGYTLDQIAVEFTNSAEFVPQSVLNNLDFVNGLYLHTFGRNGEAAGIDYWTSALEHGETRAQLIKQFATLASQSLDHTAEHIEPVVIGSVTIIHNII